MSRAIQVLDDDGFEEMRRGVRAALEKVRSPDDRPEQFYDPNRSVVVKITGELDDNGMYPGKMLELSGEVTTDPYEALTVNSDVEKIWVIAAPEDFGLSVGAPLTGWVFTAVLVGEHTDGFGIAVRSGRGTGQAGGLVMLLPIKRIEVPPPSSGCSGLSECVDQKWGPYYWCRPVTRVSGACGAWACGPCAFLEVVDGLPIPLGVPIPGWQIGSPPEDILGAALEVGFECSAEELETAPLYGVYAGDRSYIAVPGDAVGWCSDPGSEAYFQVYECTLYEKWEDCHTLPPIGNGFMADVNGCTTRPGERQVVHFSRMFRGDEFGMGGHPRLFTPLFVYKRERNQQIELRCEGGNANVYGPAAMDPCGDVLVYQYTPFCCDPNCAGGGGGGSGGNATCCSRTLASILRVSVAGEGVFNIRWDGSTYWQGSAILSCGEELFIRMAASGCGVDFSCVGTAGTWVPAAAAAGSPSCTPKFISVRWTVDMDDTGTPGCVTGKCGASLDLYIQEP